MFVREPQTSDSSFCAVGYRGRVAKRVAKLSHGIHIPARESDTSKRFC